MMDTSAVSVIIEELKIPIKYIKTSSRGDRADALVNRLWIRQLIKNQCVPEFIFHEKLSDEEVSALFKQGEVFTSGWEHITISVIKKQDKLVIPLPRVRLVGKSEGKLLLSQILYYVSHTNQKNLWKEAFKKYNNGLLHKEGKGEGGVQLTEYNTLLREAISRLYGISVFRIGEQVILPESNFQPHPNLLPALAAVETSKHFLIIQGRKSEHSLQDCVTFSPAVLSSCYVKPLLIIYQLLKLMRQLHDVGLVLGDITLHDITINQDLWIRVIPRVTDNVYDAPLNKIEGAVLKHTELTRELDDEGREGLGRLAEAWAVGALSNYDYLCELNRLGGRKLGDPRRHYVLPWVSDFASRSGANFRDLTKSKFRLNKGERQLDLTYQLPPSSNPSQVPHHIPDVLSEITYYVYLSRITPRSLLCKYVRPQWVPAEYPASIQRLFEWTPDECIPEFYTDPSVFKSIHSDLSDLEVPSWAGSAQEFVAQHRAALESQHVSERLHHWIDLTFGYKLSGAAAVKAKNVVLQLVDGHEELTGSGIVQLFNQPHPHRLPASPYWGRTPPRLHSHDFRKVCNDEDEGHSSGLEDEEPPRPSPLSLTRLMSRSKTSLLTSPVGSDNEVAKRGGVVLPKDFNPVGALVAVEALHGFTASALHSPRPRPPTRPKTSLYKQLVAARRATEMQVLGCLIVELVAAPRLRVFGSGAGPVPLSKRIWVCTSLLKSEPECIPRCLRRLVDLLLQVDSENECVTELGTPPPSAHQLLQPLLTLASFPPHFPTLYTTLCALSSLHDLSEIKVKDLVSGVELIAEESETCLRILLPYFSTLLNSPQADVIAAWYLFDHIARGLGPRATTRELLDNMLCLYDWDRPRIAHLLRKRVKLYHRSFLLRLMVRFSLPVFLEAFVPPLVEAVGGYHDLDQTTTPTPAHLEEIEEGIEAEIVTPLSPLDEDSLAESDRAAPPQSEPEVFLLEDDSIDDSQKTLSDVSLHNLLAENLDTQSTEEKEVEEFDGKVAEVSPEENWRSKSFGQLKKYVEQETTDLEYSKVRDVAGDSVLWLAARLGPVLTARALTRNLLRMLALCYSGHDNLSPTSSNALPWFKLNGDENAHAVLHCLSAIAGLYGEQLIVVQYLPHMADLVQLCKKKLTPNLEAGLIGSLVLLSTIVSQLSNSTFADILQDLIVRNVVSPALRLLASVSTSLPSGFVGRQALAHKLLGTLTSLVRTARPPQRIPLLQTLQRFFLAFSKAHSHIPKSKNHEGESVNKSKLKKEMSESPPLSLTPSDNLDAHRLQAFVELKEVLNAEFAYVAYTPFANFFGEALMEQSLRNYDFIKELCAEYAKSRHVAGHHLPSTFDIEPPEIVEPTTEVTHRIGSFSNVVVVGNRIDLQEPVLGKSNSPTPIEEPATSVNRKPENANRHLRGNWLAYWEHEIGRPPKDSHLNVKQIKLQGFAGHSGSVRHIVPLTSENSFMSAGRDKTVRLWSLRSQGDGGQVCGPQWSYTGHRKGVCGLGMVERARVVASCDSSQLHLWDPFVGRTTSLLDISHPSALLPLPPPSALVLLATPDPSLRAIDARTASCVNELKVSGNAVGLVRCMIVSPNSTWLAVGHASGVLTILDLKMGTIIVSWKAHDAEVLQLVAVDEQTLISSSLDQALSVWNICDGKLKFVLKGPTEPVHCLQVFENEVISGTTANRIGVHTDVTNDASFSSTKLRSDTLRGVLTSMAILPLNRLLLLGADSGTISLIC